MPFSVCFCENLFWRDKRAAFRHTQKKGDVFLQRRRFHEAELPLARALPFFPCSVSLPALSHRHTEAHTGAHSLGPRRDLFIAAEKTWCVFFFLGPSQPAHVSCLLSPLFCPNVSPQGRAVVDPTLLPLFPCPLVFLCPASIFVSHRASGGTMRQRSCVSTETNGQ